MAVVVLPKTFRVGPEKHGYDYDITDININQYPVYKCRRDRDDGKGLLYLFYSDANVCMAVSASVVASSEAEIRRGAPAFKAATLGEDIRQPGEHMWHCYNDKSAAWWPPSPFVTSRL